MNCKDGQEMEKFGWLNWLNSVGYIGSTQLGWTTRNTIIVASLLPHAAAKRASGCHYWKVFFVKQFIRKGGGRVARHFSLAGFSFFFNIVSIPGSLQF